MGRFYNIRTRSHKKTNNQCVDMRWFLKNRIMHVLIVGKPLKEGFFMTLERESRMI